MWFSQIYICMLSKLSGWPLNFCDRRVLVTQLLKIWFWPLNYIKVGNETILLHLAVKFFDLSVSAIFKTKGRVFLGSSKQHSMLLSKIVALLPPPPQIFVRPFSSTAGITPPTPPVDFRASNSSLHLQMPRPPSRRSRSTLKARGVILYPASNPLWGDPSFKSNCYGSFAA